MKRIIENIKSKRRFPMFIICNIITGILLWMIVQAIYGSYIADKVDTLRDSYVDMLPNLGESFGNIGYVENVGIKAQLSDEAVDAKNVRLNDNLIVTIYLEDSFYALSDKQKCKIICGLDKELREQMSKHYKESDYGRYLYENRLYTSTITVMYGKMTATVFYDVDVDYYCKGTSYGIIDGTFCVNPYPGSNKDERLYDYSYYCGEVTEFKRWGANSLGEATSATNNGKSAKKSSYSDSYNARSYKSVQNFADDKYEEFYDYEDDYEDEDEAYDAAVDYWNDYND